MICEAPCRPLKRKRTRIYSAIRVPVSDYFAECCTTVWLFDLNVRFFGSYTGGLPQVVLPVVYVCQLQTEEVVSLSPVLRFFPRDDFDRHVEFLVQLPKERCVISVCRLLVDSTPNRKSPLPAFSQGLPLLTYPLVAAVSRFVEPTGQRRYTRSLQIRIVGARQGGGFYLSTRFIFGNPTFLP